MDKVYHSVLAQVLAELRSRRSAQAHDPVYLSPVDWQTCLDELRMMEKNRGRDFIPSASPDFPEPHFLILRTPIVPRAVA
jgi:hypothetical protein